MSEPQTLYDLCNASFAYPDCPAALANVTLRVIRGEHLALVGANGAGKSTLLQLLGGLLFATDGLVLFEETELTHTNVDHNAVFRRSFRSRVGFLFQNSEVQLFCSTVREEVAFGPLQVFAREEAVTRVRETMALLDVDRLADEPPYALSGGEKRRVALASVLAMNPEVLLLDEPTANLDPKTCDRLYEVLDKYAEDPARTIVIATHDLEAVRALADTCAVITPDHTIALHAPADAVLDNEDLLRQVNLIGAPRMRPPRRSLML